MKLRLVQLQQGANRRVASVDGDRLHLLDTYQTVYELVNATIEEGAYLSDEVAKDLSDDQLDYDAIYAGRSEWKLLPPLDHPTEPARTLVTGTGLTHLGSAQNRNAMHEKIAGAEENLTDSMKMFRWGMESGKPSHGMIGIAPEWFYKGTGTVLCAHNQPLEIPPHAEGGGEEAEIVGLYIIDPDGAPLRVGMAHGNEFSDHRFERRNYLNLAGSKLRKCSAGPELVVDPHFISVHGTARIIRNDRPLWEKAISTGEAEMCHSLGNIEHHHFKFEPHRRPGDVHVHFFGACALSFGDGIALQDGDIMEVSYDGFGRPLRNPLHAASAIQPLVAVRALK
jgi:hypothetical protein